MMSGQVLSLLAMIVQVLSFFAIFFFWGVWLTGLLGFVAFIMLQVVWCCGMSGCGLITAGVFAILDAVGNLIAGIVIMSFVGDDNSYDDEGDFPGILLVIFCFSASALWIVSAVCVFPMDIEDRSDIEEFLEDIPAKARFVEAEELIKKLNDSCKELGLPLATTAHLVRFDKALHASKFRHPK